MDKYGAQKAEQLGMPFGTANAKLRKMILFNLVQRFGLDVCYRCGGKIETIETFTIEHKKAWLNVNPDLFWDLDNIAFSHLTCNIGAATKVRAVLCYHCKKNPPRLDTQGRAKCCTSCASAFQRKRRAGAGPNGLTALALYTS